jgi:DNA-binding Lrp family transcriptional regulator
VLVSQSVIPAVVCHIFYNWSTWRAHHTLQHSSQTSRTAAVAETLSEMRGISEVYSVAGKFDLVAVVRVRENEALADLVTRAVRGVEGVTRTETLIAFGAYSRYDLVSLFSLD